MNDAFYVYMSITFYEYMIYIWSWQSIAFVLHCNCVVYIPVEVKSLDDQAL